MNPVERFRELVDRPDEQIDLAHAALAIGAAGRPHVDIESCLQFLTDLAFGVDDLDSLRHRLFTEKGFTGETEQYYEPFNSFFDVLLERKRSIPITLSVLMIEVGRRAGIKLEGIGMPGHFLVRSPLTGHYVDPYFGGTVLSEQGCEQRFRQVTGSKDSAVFGPEMLPVNTNHQILDRMLNNLKSIFRSRGDGPSLELTLRLRLALPTVAREEVADLGEALKLQGKFLEGAAEIEAVVQDNPELAGRLAPASRALRASLN